MKNPFRRRVPEWVAKSEAAAREAQALNDATRQRREDYARALYGAAGATLKEGDVIGYAVSTPDGSLLSEAKVGDKVDVTPIRAGMPVKIEPERTFDIDYFRARERESFDVLAVERWKAGNPGLIHELGDEVLPRAYVEAEREAGREFVIIATAQELRIIQKLRANQEAAQEAAQGPSDEPGFTRINEQETHEPHPTIVNLGDTDRALLHEIVRHGDEVALAKGESVWPASRFSQKVLGEFPPERGPAGDEPAGEPKVGADEGEVTRD